MLIKRLVAGLCAASLLLLASGCGTQGAGKGGTIAAPAKGEYPFYASYILDRSLLKANDASWRVGMVVGNSVKVITGVTGNPGMVYTQELPEAFAATATASFAEAKGTVKFLCGESSSPYVSVTLEYDPAGKVTASLYNGTTLLCTSGAVKTKSTDFKVVVDNAVGDGKVQLHVTGTQDFAYHTEGKGMDVQALSQLKTLSFSADTAGLSITDIAVDLAPYKMGSMKAYAHTAMNDMLRNFWWGDLDTGMLRGGFGGSFLYLLSLYNYYSLSQDEVSRKIFERQEYMLLNHLEPSQVKVAGTSTTPAGDDAGYFSLYYMYLYRVTQNPEMLEYTKALIHSIYDRWWDDIYGGGLWYNNLGAAGGGTGSASWMPRFKSAYSTSTVMAGFEYYDVTDDQEIFDMSVKEYEWMATHLNEGRDDGLYFAEYSDLGAGNGGSADQISPEGSSIMLNGNMGMAVCSYEMYKYTGEQKYMDRVLATLEGILNREVVNGLFLVDRDPTTGSSFMGYFVEMLMDMHKKGIDHGYLKRYMAPFYATATIIATNNRTEDGYYNGAWYYLEEGEKSYADMAGQIPQLIVVSGNSSHVITAAAMLENYVAGANV